jgi:hypothetical protein
MRELNAPAVDDEVKAIKLGLCGQQHIHDVLKGERKRERERKFADTHQGRADHKSHVGLNAEQESGEWRIAKSYAWRIHGANEPRPSHHRKKMLKKECRIDNHATAVPCAFWMKSMQFSASNSWPVRSNARYGRAVDDKVEALHEAPFRAAAECLKSRHHVGAIFRHDSRASYAGVLLSPPAMDRSSKRCG